MQQTDEKARYFASRLRERLAHHIRHIILFGSRARGDAREGSDYDFVVILDENTPEFERAVLDTEVEFLNRFDTLSSSLVYDTPEWEARKKFPIGLNVAREGIAV